MFPYQGVRPQPGLVSAILRQGGVGAHLVLVVQGKGVLVGDVAHYGQDLLSQQVQVS